MTRVLYLISVIVLTVLAGCATPPQQSKSETKAAITSGTLDLTQDTDDLWYRIRRGFAIPNIHTELADYWTQYYASHPDSVLLMTQRASKYLYHIVDELHQRGMPTELALLPFVESAYDPSALSRSKASGLWQFIPSTGRYYNLRQDWWQDERRDPIASTNAALDYLEYLYEFQGDWHLALASYNWGEGAVKRAIEKNERQDLPTDYLSLNMPEETRNYVPKLQAFKNIIAEPKKYGLTLPNVSNTPYFTKVRKYQDIDIEVAAQLAEMPVEEFKALNASFNLPVITADQQPVVLIPIDKIDKYQKNLRTYKGKLSSWKVHKLKNGESADAIAREYGISLSELRKINGFSSDMPSDVVLIPDDIERLKNSKTEAINVTQPSARSMGAGTHTIKKGDTLYNLARRYKTTVSELRKLNGLSNNTLKAGTRLRLPGTI